MFTSTQFFILKKEIYLLRLAYPFYNLLSCFRLQNRQKFTNRIDQVNHKLKYILEIVVQFAL